MDKMKGNRNRKISVVVTESSKVTITRKANNNQDFKFHGQIGRFDDYVPTAALRVAGIDQVSESKMSIKNGDLVIIGVESKITPEDIKIFEPRVLDI